LQAPDQGPRVRLLLLGAEPAHDRPARARRHLLGGEQPPRQALERDDARDCKESQAARQVRLAGMAGARIAVFGAGYVGLVTGACFAELGHSVTIRDVVPEKIDALRAGRVPIFEPGLEELIERNRERLAFTLDVGEAIAGAEFVYVCVDTPPTYSGDADLSRVWTVVEELPQATDVERPLLVMKSTVPVGTGEKVRHSLDARGLGHVGYVANPEFTAEGSAVHDFLHTDRIVVGSFEPGDGDRVEGLHAGIDAPVVRADVNSAEMVKLASNAFLMTRISFINEIANVCEATGA